MLTNPSLGKLGFKPQDRVVIIHADDIGMCQAGLTALPELLEFGLVSSGSVMVPCPWFEGAARFAVEHPAADLGVHLTLTSEWESYRWAPVSSLDVTCGLIDEQGYLHKPNAAVQASGEPAAVNAELTAQIVRARAAGIDPTHIDTHMGAVVHPKFLKSYIDLALAHKLPLLMLRPDRIAPQNEAMRDAGVDLDDTALAALANMLNSVEEHGIPLLDHICGLPLGHDSSERMAEAKAVFDSLQPGLTHFYIHPACDTPELQAITADWSCRVADFKVFTSPKLRDFVRSEDIHVIGYRELRALI